MDSDTAQLEARKVGADGLIRPYENTDYSALRDGALFEHLGFHFGLD